MATKKYESMRIMSLEGSVLYKNEGFTATKDGKPDPKAFRGILDESLDTLKLAEVYDRHKSEFDYPYLDGKKRFCRHRLRSGFLSLTMCSIGRHHTVTENKLSNPLLEGNILIKPMRHCFSY